MFKSSNAKYISESDYPWHNYFSKHFFIFWKTGLYCILAAIMVGKASHRTKVINLLNFLVLT